tara:strand:- start:46 stop:1005 length:960 start_codon:yes stop_codon:yes gene_type:complete
MATQTFEKAKNRLRKSDITRTTKEYDGELYELDIYLMEVTPDIAQDLLKDQIVNRNISKTQLKRFEAAHSGGYWCFLGDPLRIADSGKLMDGQHKLVSLIEAGRSEEFLIIEGQPESIFDLIDQNRTKQLKDILKNAGATDPNAQSGIVSLLWKLKYNPIKASRYGLATNPSLREARLFWKSLGGDDTFHSLKVFGALANREVRLSQTVAGTMRYITDLDDAAKSQRFWSSLIEGTNFDGRDDPAQRLWKFLNLEAVKRENTRGANSRRFDDHEALAWVYFAWTNYKAGTRLRKFEPNSSISQSMKELKEDAVRLVQES